MNKNKCLSIRAMLRFVKFHQLVMELSISLLYTFSFSVFFFYQVNHT